jgi:hypothetical protein
VATPPTQPPPQAGTERTAASAPTCPELDPTDVGASNWRSVVLRQAQSLSDELDALPRNFRTGGVEPLGQQVRDHIGAAREIAKDAPHSWKTLRNWWTGNGVETAWDHLQAAREDLLAIAPTAAVRAQLPSLQRRLVSTSPDPAHDPQLDAIKKIAATDGDLSSEDREQIRAAHEHVRIAEDDHSEARSFRNNLLLWSGGLAVGSIVLAGITQDGFRTLVIGAVAGVLTTALAWRDLTHLAGPFAVNTAQAALKVPAGAAAALLGVLLVRSGIISGLSVTSSTAYGYAVVFGLSQQALTQVVDNAAKKIGS